MPGLVATPMTGRKTSDLKEAAITADECATGILRNATSGYTNGGTLHEVVGLLTKIIVEIFPLRAFLALSEKSAN